MNLREALAAGGAVRRAGEGALFRATTLTRVGLRTGLGRSLTARGALALARELARGKPNPSVMFRFHAANTPHRVGLVVPGGAGEGRDRVYSFFEMDEAIDRLALALAARGVGSGVAVLFVLKNRAELVLGPPAVARVGGAAVSISWRSTAPELAYVAEHSGARVVVFDADVEPVVREAMESLPAIPRENFVVVGARAGEGEGEPARWMDRYVTWEALLASAPPAGGGAGRAPAAAGDEGAVVSYTSGTTGKPKGAVRKFPKEALASALAVIGETPLGVGEVHLAVCPLYHATAFGFVAMAYMLGCTVVLLPEFKPRAFLEAVERYRVSSTAVVPTMLYRLMEVPSEEIRARDLSSLKAIFSGGGPLTGSLAAEVMDAVGERLFNFYGATETGIVTLASPKDLREAPGTIGRAVPGVEIRLLGEDGLPVAEGEVGELYARSGMLVAGYHADEAATARSMREGFFSVGDLARRDAEGRIFLEGRKRDMIVSGGVNVYPAEVEAALEAHPAVREAAVVGSPDAEWGERVRAFVVLRPEASCDAAELGAFCRARLAGPKVPRDFVFLPELPKNPTGKVLKRELRA